MSRPAEAVAVVDLGFGDAGKGSITDFLVRDGGAGLVVRFQGGAQAGHNVVTPDGRHHTFSQFCAGSFVRGTLGLLASEFLLHPLGMLVEAEHLAKVGVTDAWQRTAIDSRVRVITPYQQAAGRIRELLRGAAAHGSCGIGVGECVHDSLQHPDDTVRAGDLHRKSYVREQLVSQRERKRDEMARLSGARGVRAVDELSVFDDDELIDRVVDAWQAFVERASVVSPDEGHELIADQRRIVFEGAQGILLDEAWGFAPHTTWSDCTSAGARALLPADRELHVLGVTRAYAVRHGCGPFPTADCAPPLADEHNDAAGWQGRFRTGSLDAVLLGYARDVVGQLDSVAVTCLDRVPDEMAVCVGYRGDAPPALARADEAGIIRELVPGAKRDLGHREQLGAWLRTVEPELVTTTDVRSVVEGAVRCPVQLESRGPSAMDKRWRTV